MERQNIPDSGALGLWPEECLWKERHRPEVRAELMERYTAFSVSFTLKHHRAAESLERLAETAKRGLGSAISTFCPETGTAFIVHASPIIESELERSVRTHKTARTRTGCFEKSSCRT